MGEKRHRGWEINIHIYNKTFQKRNEWYHNNKTTSCSFALTYKLYIICLYLYVKYTFRIIMCACWTKSKKRGGTTTTTKRERKKNLNGEITEKSVTTKSKKNTSIKS